MTALITNHTFSNLVLRPPGLQANGLTPDEGIYKALGDAMAHENGYASQLSYQLYDTSGTTEDWSYFATGGLGFTVEIGPTAFHPPFADVVAEWRGTTPAADRDDIDGGGNREAYYKAAEYAAAAAGHSRIVGTAPAGATLRLRKRFTSQTAPVLDASGSAGKPLSFTDTLQTLLTVPANGRFTWHVNPSTRPRVGASTSRPAHGTPSPPPDVRDQRTGATVPCLTSQDPPPGCYEDHVITVPAGPGIDNHRMTVGDRMADGRQRLGLPAAPRGRRRERGRPAAARIVLRGDLHDRIGDAQRARARPREVRRARDQLARDRGARPVGGARDLRRPPGGGGEAAESWSLTCEGRRGKVGARAAVRVGRGGKATLNLLRCAAVAGSCAPARGRVTERAIWKARLGRSPAAERRALPYRRVTRSGRDRFCVAGGGALTVAYARSSRRGRAAAVTSTSRRHRLRTVRPGSPAAAAPGPRARRAPAGRLPRRLARRGRQPRPAPVRDSLRAGTGGRCGGARARRAPAPAPALRVGALGRLLWASAVTLPRDYFREVKNQPPTGGGIERNI